MKNNNGYVFIDFILSIFILVMLSGTLMPLVHTLNKTIEKEHYKIKLYQMVYQTLQSKDNELKFNTDKFKLNRKNNQICLEDVIRNEKVCVKK
ncbi:competence type IV pilus minor pilin ComGE [Mammaliicoccus sp. Dog046]|uniref:competence type IV pilus minor pilin ComGE n=1 Tax=Mammaliicoccus sp. Dog046 TaxID=3034233 RepID=UPI002B25C460|nr:competence type IV pilus minor pilin ComGE [Mammaliicoccus sp. Dog046]WQK86622.1 competence type IV pilus minor pilin ComGE [Mammaliicoccus sp. Dog046]